MSKIHLKLSAEPLHFLSNGELFGECGASVKQATAVLMLDLQATGLPDWASLQSSLSQCRTCLKMVASADFRHTRMYLYAIAPAQEVREVSIQLFDPDILPDDTHHGLTIVECEKAVDKVSK